MSNVVELSTGHVFAKGSVKCITPIVSKNLRYCLLQAIGVGFSVDIHIQIPDKMPLSERDAYVDKIRQEFIDKLLK